MRQLKFIVLLFLLMPLVSMAKLKVDFEEYDLPNGLHVILSPDNSTPNVVVSVCYHVGSKNEDTTHTGFAHFFEHLMFEGTDNIGRHEFDKHVSRAGGQLNAYTTNDKTYYYEKLPSNQLKLGLWLESERMMHAKVEAIGIKTQKDVVVQEKKQRYDNRPYGGILIEVMKRAYTVHPYRWTTIGNEAHIRNSEDSDFVNFYKTFYVPNNATLTIVGDFDPTEVKKDIALYFADIPKGEQLIPRPTEVEPVKTAECRDTIYDKISLPALIEAYHIPAIGTSDFYAVDMLTTLLTDGKSSRLYKDLVDKKQIALQVSSFPFAMEHPGLAFIFALPTIGNDLKDLEASIEEELVNVKTNLVGEREFQKLRNIFENDIVSRNSTIEKRADNLAETYTFQKNTALVNSELDKYLAVTREDIMRVANTYFIPENRVCLYYLPQSNQ